MRAFITALLGALAVTGAQAHHSGRRPQIGAVCAGSSPKPCGDDRAREGARAEHSIRPSTRGSVGSPRGRVRQNIRTPDLGAILRSGEENNTSRKRGCGRG